MQMCSRIDVAWNLRGFDRTSPVGEYLPNPAAMGSAAGHSRDARFLLPSLSSAFDPTATGDAWHHHDGTARDAGCGSRRDACGIDLPPPEACVCQA
jgi:hypothetical protein